MSSSKTNNLNKLNKVESIVANVICILIFIAFGYIALMSLLQTSVIDPGNYSAEVILYQTDNVALNIFFIAIFFAFTFKMKKNYDFFAKINIKYCEIVLVAFSLIIGLVWIFSVTSVPAADSYNVFETATSAAKDNYSAFINGSKFYNSDYYNNYSYYNYYPFQLGFVFICEMVYRIFGTSTSMPIQVINVICVSLAYLGIAKISAKLYKKRSIEFFTILLLMGCLQPLLLCTFAYGNIIGMCCSIWASYFLIKYFQTQKYINLLPCGILLVLATLAKYNNMIVLVAFVIVLIVHTIIKKKWQSIAFALAICIATVGASSLVIMSYENRANVKLSNGVSQTMYLDMGLNESYMAPGWYNAIALNTYKNSGLNDDIANQKAWKEIETRLDYMGKNPGYAIDFFGKKIVSQWNEPTFESIWVSKVKSHSSEINGIGKSVYDGSFGQLLELYFNFYMQIIYGVFAIGIVCLIYKKKANIETILLPLIVLGGFGYHLLFEGKSQYILTYIILLLPTVAYGFSLILNGKFVKIRKAISNLKNIPE